MKKRKKIRDRIKHHYIAHKGNKFRPTLFSRESVAIVALALVLIEGAYLFQVNVVMQSTGFTAAVLPSALTTLANADREVYALPVLAEDPLLAQAAQRKADDMASRGYFAHISPDGTSFRDILNGVGYNFSYAGENLAVDFSESIDVEKAWMNSPTHRANILKGEYTHVGYGVARGMYEGREVTFVAQFFATKRAPAVAVVSTPELQQVAVSAPDEILVIAAPEPQEEVRVLGTGVAGTYRGQESMAVLATSPSRIVWYTVSAFTALVALLFSLAVITHIRNRYLYLEVLVGGTLILAIGLSLLWYNSAFASRVQVPSSAQSASVSAVF